ncbi:MAG: hypothetical protein KKB51_07020 [Candidatus Riflebacteria bacterium]|nr:hypothetical protein [Candidatus Riflebacteria bacterium]
MSLEIWAENGWLKPRKTTKQEIQNLLAIVDRDLEDASQSNLSPDWRFGIAYNAALKPAQYCFILQVTDQIDPWLIIEHCMPFR